MCRRWTNKSCRIDTPHVSLASSEEHPAVRCSSFGERTTPHPILCAPSSLLQFRGLALWDRSLRKLGILTLSGMCLIQSIVCGLTWQRTRPIITKETRLTWSQALLLSSSLAVDPCTSDGRTRSASGVRETIAWRASPNRKLRIWATYIPSSVTSSSPHLIVTAYIDTISLYTTNRQHKLEPLSRQLDSKPLTF